MKLNMEYPTLNIAASQRIFCHTSQQNVLEVVPYQWFNISASSLGVKSELISFPALWHKQEKSAGYNGKSVSD